MRVLAFFATSLCVGVTHAAEIRPLLKASFDLGGDTLVTAVFTNGKNAQMYQQRDDGRRHRDAAHGEPAEMRECPARQERSHGVSAPHMQSEQGVAARA